MLGYKNIPTTEANFFESERLKRLDDLFISPEEVEHLNNPKANLDDADVYRLMRILGSFEGLKLE